MKKEAFANDKSITSVMIPKSVGSIQSKAFANCVNLKEVILGNNANVTSPPMPLRAVETSISRLSRIHQETRNGRMISFCTEA
ncbi:MAG: leucine-rich repeat protein [Blautia sp.]|nr:leucine-rich repeat protein [Blautia sp.]